MSAPASHEIPIIKAQCQTCGYPMRFLGCAFYNPWRTEWRPPDPDQHCVRCGYPIRIPKEILDEFGK